jgi:hypothetical protein
MMMKESHGGSILLLGTALLAPSSAFLSHQTLRHSLAFVSTPPPSPDAGPVESTTTTALRSTLLAPPPDASTSAEIPKHIKDVWGIEPEISKFPGAKFPLGSNDETPPILELPNFLTSAECSVIQGWATQAIESGADECDDYLNYRVNKEIEETGETSEGRTLIDEHSLEECELSAKNKGGFRVRLDEQFVRGLLRNRILGVLGMNNREFVFEEGAWIRPTPKSVVVRDQTVVFYAEGNGVPPHVDGRDATLLVYLSDVPEGVGGRTVFPEDGFSQTPVKGTALLYRSKEELLHYSEAMTPNNEKWIMQLLLDFNHDYRPGDTVVNFQTGESYVWDGE